MTFKAIMFLLKCFQCMFLLPVLFSISTSWVIPRFATLGDAVVPLKPFELDEFLNGTYRAKNWNGTWVSGNILI